MSAKRFLYIFTSAPYSNALGQEGLEAVLIAAAFENPISCVFVHNGVFQLKKQQDVGVGGLKQVTKTFAALTDFGVDDCFVDSAALAARGLDENDLMIAAKPIEQEQIALLIKEHDRVLVF